MNTIANVMRGALVAIASAVDNVEAGHTTRDEHEELARVCDRLAQVLRRDGAQPPAVDGDVIAVVEERPR
ncbi:hypothetical protein [Saccharopolyspora flava]|uniref:Uncharacterized protein n=1 Tax=Saccharopolyspora flava TaxID=95161 RepID=A0A1I6UD62_9PSEU|nr:hypothetical protein [Saccharopolyspora flava]SFS99375.1 hypothetical protein SAMN05660874_04801 [Saccharopolyspora flava]